ncbi:MAG: hypothetical protein ABEJ85_00440 [Haloarculaceae archaeon]
MSKRDALSWPHSVVARVDSSRIRRLRRSTVAVLFGDGTGLTLFLATLAVFVVLWRAGAFINDAALFVPQLERLAAGHLSLGAPGDVARIFPGMHLVDGQVYGRNYGQVALAVPVYWLLDAVGMAAFQWFVVVAWSGLLAAVAVRVGTHYGRRRLGAAVGGAVAIAALLANAATFRSTFDGLTAIVALQVTTMLVAAFTGVLLYRIVARQTDRRLGVLAGAVTVVATPVGFWATVPKRHAFTATLVVLALYGLVRSRDDPAPSARLGQAGFRALAYASAGLLAWIHAPEGFTLFLAVAVVDLPTAPRNDRRTLAVIGGALALSLLPVLATNALISGNPFDPPRFLPEFPGEGVDGPVLDPGGSPGATDGGTEGSGAMEGTDSVPILAPIWRGIAGLLPSTLLALLQRGFVRYVSSLQFAATDPGSLATVFLRWGRRGYTPGNIFFGGGTNVSVLAAAPVTAALLVTLVVRSVDAVRHRTRRAIDGLDTADLFALVAAGMFVALFMKNLPLRVQLTVRYLHPLYPLLIYAVFRQSWVTRTLTESTTEALWGYETAVLIGVPLAVAGLLVADLSKGDVFQAYQSVALFAAGLLVVAGLTSTVSSAGRRASAVAFGLAAGVATVFLLVTALVVMHYGPSALPAVDVITGEIRFATLRYG